MDGSGGGTFQRNEKTGVGNTSPVAPGSWLVVALCQRGLHKELRGCSMSACGLAERRVCRVTDGGPGIAASTLLNLMTHYELQPASRE